MARKTLEVIFLDDLRKEEPCHFKCLNDKCGEAFYTSTIRTPFHMGEIVCPDCGGDSFVAFFYDKKEVFIQHGSTKHRKRSK
ncbi:MAG: hypothetical protein F2563_02355 [Actinobacteria bacterium]|nr:hypothetical protein [Actinomycetota bacterium]